MRKNCLSYPVEFIEDPFVEGSRLADVLKKVAANEKPRVLLVADANVVQRMNGLGTQIGRFVKTYGIELAANPIVLAGSEKIKSDRFQSMLTICSAALDAKVGHNDIMLVMGGGTLLDVAGYAAAQVRGGVKLVRMPTTPASMIDAAFATSAAIDSANVKDALCVPCEPAAVVIDWHFARLVLDGVWNGGIGEAIRLALAHDGALIKKLVTLAPKYHARDEETFVCILKECFAVRQKKGPTEIGEWSARRMEVMSEYKLPHGYAVPIGVILDMAYAVAKGLLKAADQELVLQALDACCSLDGVAHSQHLLNQTESLLCGLDAWRLSSGKETVTIPVGLGKTREVRPDRATYAECIKKLVAPTTAA